MPDAPARPNILLILSDQHRYDSLGANGSPVALTPHLDLLARQGASFEHAFTPIAVCVPARCCLVTGQWATQHGALNNFDGETFKRLDSSLPVTPRLVADAGYRTVHIGKWHVDPVLSPCDFGFEVTIPGHDYRQWRESQGLPALDGEGGWLGAPDRLASPEQTEPGWGASQVIEAVERVLADGKQFYIEWHLNEPHLPCRPAEPYASLYKPEDIRPYPGFADTFINKPFIQRQMRASWDVEAWNWAQWAIGTTNYLGMVSLIDSQVGRILDCLERNNISGETLVMYCTDHGDMNGSHGMFDKHCVMYDDIMRVPLLARWPGVIPAGARPTGFVSSMLDLAATMVIAAGARLPASFAGQNLVPLARGETPGRADIFATYHGNQFGAFTQRMVRDARWKYIWNATDVDELYDLCNDPGELTNRAADLECAGELARLRRRLLEWMAETRDPLNNPWIRDQLSAGRKLAA